MSDNDDDFEENYFSFKIKKIKSFFSDKPEENLIRCEFCSLLSYIKSIKFENTMILIYASCRNNHEKKYDLIEYLNKFKENKIENFLCCYDKKNKFDIETFIYCPECKIIFCPNCQNAHDKGSNLNHHLINAKYMDFYCFEHIKPFKKFCLSCEENICNDCEEKHNKHDIINLADDDYKIDYAKFKQNVINLNKFETYLKSIDNSSKMLMSINYYKSKFYYLNDLFINILKTYEFEKKNLLMNFELFYNFFFILNNNKYFEFIENKFELIKSRNDFNEYNLDLNNYPLKLNDQQTNSKDYLNSKIKGYEEINNKNVFNYFNCDIKTEISSNSDISSNYLIQKKKSFNFIKLTSIVFKNIEKIITIGAEKMNSKFCFSCYSRFNSKKNYIIYNDLNRFLNIYSIEKRKNLRILKNLNNPDEDIYENVKSIKVFVDIVNNEKIVIFSTEQKSINKLKIYELKKYSLRDCLTFDDNPINDFCFYNLDKKCFIALNEQGKKKIDIYKDGKYFKSLNNIENVQCMECYEDIGLKTKIYLLVTGNNYLKSFDMNNYKLYQNYNINNEDSYIFSKFYITKDKLRIITSLKNGDLKLIDFNDPNSYEIFNPDNNTIPIISFNFFKAFYLFAATEDKKIKIFDINKKKIINTYYFDNNIISLEIMPDEKNSFLYVYDDKGNIFQFSLNQFK